MNITILGSGAFGLALAHSLLINKNNITIWSKFEEETSKLKNIYTKFKFTNNLQETITTADIIIIAIPIEFIQNTLIELKQYNYKGIILIASKGIETKQNKFAYEILESILPNNQYGILSGGTFAKDMQENSIMGITLATTSPNVIELSKKALKNNILKLEISNDIIGVSICGAIKNVMAIGFGILDGANYPESSKFLFLTEAILEIKNIIKHLKGNEKTILSYAGIDDIMMTCTSSKSRNYTLGFMIGINEEKNKIEEYKSNTTIEGLKTTKAFYTLIKEKSIYSPIVTAIYNILYQEKDKKELINYLKKLEK